MEREVLPRAGSAAGRCPVFTIAILLVILSLIVVILLMVEIRQFRTGRRLISRRRFALRLAAGMLMLVLLAAVFVGLFVMRLTQADAHPALFMGYWTGCIVIAVVLVWAMMADVREVDDRLTERQHQIWRDMAELLASRMKREGGESSDSEVPGGAPPAATTESDE